MAELPAMYHDAYSFAVREWRALGLSDHPSDDELATLQGLVLRYINRLYPGVPAAQRASAVSYGVASAERDLISPEVGGLPGFVGQVVGSVEAGVGAVAGEAETIASGALRGLEKAVGAILRQILQAVPLPRSALPHKVPTQLTDAYATLAHQVGTLTPTALAGSARTRTRMRSLGR